MVRKVGFEQEKPKAKKSIADSYLDEFRARSAQKRRAEAPVAPSRHRVRRNWVLIVFLSVWLMFWSFGILTVSAIIASGGAPLFLFIWLIAALVGWFVVFVILRRQIKGTPIDD